MQPVEIVRAVVLAGGDSSKEYRCPFQQRLNIDRMFTGAKEYPIHRASQPSGFV